MFIRYLNQQLQVASDSTGMILPLPPLGDLTEEILPFINVQPRSQGSFHLWEGNGLIFGFTNAQVNPQTDSKTAYELYQELFKITQSIYLYRTWNYVPDLNSGEGDRERYKQFCEGRSMAFHETFGDNDSTYMPAGTCVGIDGDQLVICFIAGTQPPDHHENPNQIPAYRYPRQYGPKTPSFARATSVHINNQHYRFISGTAAVLGHESKGLNSLKEQLKVTCDNLEKISEQSLVGNQKSNTPFSKGTAKVFLRNPSDYAETKSYLEKRFPSLTNSIIYLKTDICRKELLVEIEILYIDSQQAESPTSF